MQINKLKEIFQNVNFGLLLFVAVIVYLLLLIRSDIVESQRMSAEAEAVSREIRAQETLKKELSIKVKLLNRNDHIEMLARERLGMVKQGEGAYKAVNIQGKE